ncbi:hypothetical protein [Deinococcus sp. UR1]|uniref:hypothetical protein n=1 Tax=Deinococcus sp. UR1 TaxID=1704277 RepID=UPI000A56EE5D|nr:hypothetical protein [Deinococcus sp. UR1]
MLSKMFRGMFRQPKDLPVQFAGDPEKVLSEFVSKYGFIKIKSGDYITIQGSGLEAQFYVRDQCSSLLFIRLIPGKEDISPNSDFDPYFSLLKLDGRVFMSREISMRHQGDPFDVIEKAVDHVAMSCFGITRPHRGGHFRPYLNGKTYGASWQAFAHFMKEIKGDRVTSEASNYISFDTGGLPLGLQKSDNSQEIIISYDLRDYEGLYDKYREQILELINGVALRHRQICFLIDRERLLICNKFYVSPETDALNLFTAQLQAIHDALLDYLTTVQEAPEHAWLRAAREVFVRGQPLPRA